MSQQQHARPRHEGEAAITKLLDGFILGRQESEGHWSNGWDPEGRPDLGKLVHCYLHVSLLPTRLLVQPLFRKVPLALLGADVAPGTPITMLPYGTPAYYIGPYVGSAREQEQAFRESLQGLGCRNWASEGFVVCWMTVSNSPSGQQVNGATVPAEERGLMAVWPRALCLLSTASSRQPLASIPTLPSSVCPPVSPPRPIPASNPQKEAGSQGQAQAPPSVPAPTPPPSSIHQTTHNHPSHTASLALGALKSLTVDGSAAKYGVGLESVASEMTSYVDWIVKEREREKERLAKEKERLRRDERPAHSASTNFTTTTRGMSTRSHQPSAPTTVPTRDAPAISASTHRPQGSATNPQGYYPSPPDINSPATTFQDPSRSGAEVSPQITLEPLGSGEPTQTSTLNVGSTAEDVQIPDASTGRPTLDDSLTSMQGSSNEAVPQLTSSAFDIDAVMDVTDDDFNFFDDVTNDLPMPSFAGPDATFGGLLQASGATSEPSSNPLPHDPFDLLNPNPQPTITSSRDSDATHAPTTNAPIGSLQSHAILHATTALPLSPARTPSTSPSIESRSPSPLPSATEEVAAPVPVPEEPTIPPEFPYLIKEYVPKLFEPLPVPTTAVLADMKYSLPGAKYNIPTSSVSSPALVPAADPSPVDDGVLLVPNEFIPTTVPSQSTAPPSMPLPLQRIASRLLEHRYPLGGETSDVEHHRSKRRTELRKVRDRPIRHGNFEVWHSKKFIDKFATGTDPRVNHVKRLRGQKRNLEWSPYPYLRTEGDGDARSTWKTWVDFVEVVPSDLAAALHIEDSSDDADSPSGFATEEETVIAGDPETAEDSPEGTADVRSPASEGEKLAQAGPGHAFQTPPPTTRPPTPLGASLLQTLFHPHHIFPLANAQTPPAAPIANVAPAQAPISVPTPVSPAAHFVQAGEGAAILEGAADVLTREAVENPLWADAARGTYGWTISEPVYAMDIDSVVSVFGSIESIEAKTALQSIPKVSGKHIRRVFDDKWLMPIAAPPSYAAEMNPLTAVFKPSMLALAQANEVLHLSAPSVRFWEKLGLMPLNGSKDVVAFALYDEENTPNDLLPVLSDWLGKASETYKVSMPVWNEAQTLTWTTRDVGKELRKSGDRKQVNSVS